MRTALASSLNVPAVRTLMQVGPDVLAQRLVALGLPLVHGGDYYGYSLALGSADVTLLSLTNAYIGHSPARVAMRRSMAGLFRVFPRRAGSHSSVRRPPGWWATSCPIARHAHGRSAWTAR
ncbi:hypothetical protein CDEF62S_05329 [Castellaniella defragrans]